MVVKPLGDLELETLGFVADNAPISVGDVAKRFGEPRDLARTTILTVMERLRAKGYLARKQVGGIYRYTPKVPQQELLSKLVGDFVERSLGGSLSPFVAYLADTGKLTEAQVDQLQQLIEGMEEDPS